MVGDNERNWLMRIPILGYILRKIKKYQEAIKRTLKTGNETEVEIRKRSFLLGIFKISFNKRFYTLKLKKNLRENKEYG